MSLLTDAAFVTSRTVTENYTPVVTQAVAYTPLWAYVVLFQFLVGLAIAFGIYVLLTSQRLRKKFFVRVTKAVFDVAMKMIENKKKEMSDDLTEKLLRAHATAALPPGALSPVVPAPSPVVIDSSPVGSSTSPVEPPVFPDVVPPIVVLPPVSEPVVEPEPEPEPEAPVDPVLLARLADMVILIQQSRPGAGTPTSPSPD